MSANEEKVIDAFGATLTRGKLIKGGGALVVGLSVIGAAGVGGKAAKAAASTTLDSDASELVARDPQRQHDPAAHRQGRARPGLGQHRVRADHGGGAQRSLYRDHPGDHG